MTKYLSKEPFSINNAGNEKYSEGWDRIFGGRPKEPEPMEIAQPEPLTVDFTPVKEAYDAAVEATRTLPAREVLPFAWALANAADDFYFALERLTEE